MIKAERKNEVIEEERRKRVENEGKERDVVIQKGRGENKERKRERM